MLDEGGQIMVGSRRITMVSFLLALVLPSLGTLVPAQAGTPSLGIPTAASCGVSTSDVHAPIGLQVAGLDTTTPVLSGIVSSVFGTGTVAGNIYLEDSAATRSVVRRQRVARYPVVVGSPGRFRLAY
jgi:hypothetical protein